jgi:murein DD-endopeptidase MepM/ murein hydrolase activator NlpD
VVFVGSLLTVRGNVTIIDHGWGIYSGFYHQSKINVKVGDVVEAGQIIGQIGGTGRVTGPHLHWDLFVNGIQVDPLDWLDRVYP